MTIAGTLSQWVSGLLLVAPFAEHETRIHITGGRLNEQPYVELTVRMMRQFGLTVEVSDDWLEYRIPAGQQATPHDYVIPPDIGSAAFGIAAAGTRESNVLLRGMTATTTAETDHPESEFLDLATAMGVPMRIDEETGFVRIEHDGSPLRPLDVDCRPIPDLLPVLSTMATFAEGTSRLWNVAHIRLKESDRVAAMLQLNRMGGRAEQGADELRVTGVGAAGLHGAAMSSFNDHRVLMSLAVAASSADGVSGLTYPRAYRISYPTFLEAMNSVGLDMSVGDRLAAQVARDDRIDAAEADGVRTHLGTPLETPAAPEPTDQPAAQPAAPQPAVPQPAVAVPELAGVDADPLVLSERVRALSQTDPDGLAVIEVGGATPANTTWKELQDEADRVSALLLELGVRIGESVAMQLPNWREFVSITLGAIQIGAVATRSCRCSVPARPR